MKYYRLHINCKADKRIFDSISEILGVEPMPFEPTKMFPEQTYDNWTFGLQEQGDEYIDFVNEFLDLIEPNLSKLEKLDISKDDILIWKLYEYEHQCAMEFHPQEMKRLGELGIHLNIDCWAMKKEQNEA